MKIYNFIPMVLIFALLASCSETALTAGGSNTVLTDSTVTIKLQEYPGALRNPLKGFTDRGFTENNPWATLKHSYIKWNEIERDSLDGIERIQDWCNATWAGVESENVKVIPRVYLHWDDDLTYWPADMTTYDYSSPQFVRRLKKMIQKLGQCWNDDPRVAHIEMGIIGKWGEHHSPAPTPEVEQLLGEEFTRAFPDKQVMVRHPWEFKDFQFGIYWDSWAHYDQMDSHGQGVYDMGERWKTRMIGGEAAYNWGNWAIQPGEDPTDTMTDPAHRNFLISTIRWLHCTQLRWVADYDHNNAAARAGAEEVQKVFGYRYVIERVEYPRRIETNQQFKVSFSVKNTGSAPFYYDWPVELALLDANGKLVWRADFDGVDIRNWLPGDYWNQNESKYDLPAESYQVSGNFTVDADLPSGKYMLALAVTDPAGDRPSLRFAINNYLTGGRHPVGYAGIGTDLTAFEIPADLFDDPGTDETLYYLLR